MKAYCVLVFSNFIYYSLEAPQLPEINDQFETSTINEDIIKVETTTDKFPKTKEPNDAINNKIKTRRLEGKILQKHSSIGICDVIRRQIERLLATPKINAVLRNIGTCVVNGAMEIISYYFPAPVIPLIASAAGMVIPFEPIVQLRRKMPVTSYRRAFNTAVNSFMNTFDRYKFDYDDDPYMTRRFNRRFMGEKSGDENKV